MAGLQRQAPLNFPSAIKCYACIVLVASGYSRIQPWSLCEASRHAVTSKRARQQRTGHSCQSALSPAPFTSPAAPAAVT
jgi:hypothetical protein